MLKRTRLDLWTTVAVLLHFLVNLAHGAAHNGAHVDISPSMMAFVVLVILLGPLAGLALSWWQPRAGAWIVAATMGGSLAFGVVNHFVILSPDHVSQVATEWRTMFGATAVLLAVLEIAGVGLGLRAALAKEVGRSS